MSSDDLMQLFEIVHQFINIILLFLIVFILVKIFKLLKNKDVRN